MTGREKGTWLGRTFEKWCYTVTCRFVDHEHKINSLYEQFVGDSGSTQCINRASYLDVTKDRPAESGEW